MSMQSTIEHKISQSVDAAHLQVINESNNHNVPANSETHFKVVVVAETFDGMRLIDRHRLINKLLADELAGGVHALAIHAYTLEEWEKQNNAAPMSPPCKGGSKANS